MAYSEDLRKKVMTYLKEGNTQESAQKVYKVGLTTIKEWKKRFKETGSLTKKELNRSFKKIDPVKLSAYIKANPDAYLRQIAEVFGCTSVAVSYALRKLNITRKKRQKYTKNGIHKSKKNL